MAKKEIITSESIRVRGRQSFLRLIEPKPFDGKGDPRWEATTLCDPADKLQLESIKLVVKTGASVATKSWGLVPLALRRIAAQFIPGVEQPDPKAKDDGIKIAFYDGSSKEYDGYDGMFVVPAHNTFLRPAVAGRNGKEVVPGDKQFPYSGCLGITSITIWGQDNQYAKRLGVNLRGVQFVEGEPKYPAFGQGDIAAEDEFQALEDEGGGDSSDLGFD
jgi:hypothetical protein